MYCAFQFHVDLRLTKVESNLPGKSLQIASKSNSSKLVCVSLKLDFSSPNASSCAVRTFSSITCSLLSPSSVDSFSRRFNIAFVFNLKSLTRSVATCAPDGAAFSLDGVFLSKLSGMMELSEARDVYLYLLLSRRGHQCLSL